MKSKLVKKALRLPSQEDFSRARISECLVALGLAEQGKNGHLTNCPERYTKTPRSEGFWGMSEWDLADTLKDIKARFKTLIVDLHPDKKPEHEPETRRIIAAYKQALKIFRQHNIQ